MDSGKGEGQRWGFKGNEEASEAASVTIRGVIFMLYDHCDEESGKSILPLGHGDPAVFPIFRTAIEAEDAVVDAVRTGELNSYAESAGILPARSAVADYLNQDLPHKLTPDDIYLTVGCNQGIEIIIQALNVPKANILLPRPGFPHYQARAIYTQLEVRHYDLLPEKDWEIDLKGIEAIADENTAAMVIINPNNPCGNVYTHEHLQKVAETARKLGIMVISDEVYDEIIYGDNPFVPMGKFAPIVPVLTLGAISKGWVVPGWRIGWMATNDPEGILEKTGVVQSIKDHMDISPDPTTFLQGALPAILKNTKQEFFDNKSALLKQNVDMAVERLEADIPCIICPKKPESCTYLLTKLNLSLLEGIEDDMDFCVKLAQEENTVLLPGSALGLKNWLRITIGVDPSLLEDGLGRIKAFCDRHAKKTEALVQAMKLSN